ncbi:MAG: hypothetical protein RRC07_14510 [Anaerolineae bacterium]|nr:hypothetical protein [Anaerolineae bacterium]
MGSPERRVTALDRPFLVAINRHVRGSFAGWLADPFGARYAALLLAAS